MFISKLQLINFRSHVDTTLNFDRITFIRGSNAAGKSSVEKALQIALAGNTDETTSDGKGSVGLIRKGAKKASINVGLQLTPRESNHTERLVQCALNGTARNIIASDPANQQWDGSESLLKTLSAHRQTLACLINNRYFVDLADDAQQNLLASIVLPTDYAWPEWVKPAVAGLALKVDWKQTPFAIIEQAYKATFAERTNINRDVKNFRAPEGDTSAAANYDLIDQQLKERRQQLEAAVAAQAQESSASASSANAKAELTRRLEEAQKRVAREEQSIAGIEANLLSKERIKTLRATAKQKRNADDLDAELARIRTELTHQRGLKDKLSDLSNQPACPTCGTAITAELVMALMEPLNMAVNTLGDRERQVIKDRKDIGDTEAAARFVARHEDAEKDMEAAKSRIAEDRATITECDKRIDELKMSAAAPAPQEGNAQSADLRERVNRGQTALLQASAARDLLQRQTTSESIKAELLTKQQTAEKLVKYFGDEVKAELLAVSIGAFTSSMNEALTQWGYQCRISMEPYTFSIIFAGDGEAAAETELELKYLSKSQRYRFAVAFQFALAVVSNMRFVIVDEADILDKAGKAGLFNILNNQQIDQAIIIATNELDQVPVIPGAGFIKFTNAAGPNELPTTQVRRLTA